MKRKIILTMFAAVAALCCAGMLSACGKTANPPAPSEGMTKPAAYAVAAELGYNGTEEQFETAITNDETEEETALVKSVEVNENNEIIVTYTDGTWVSLGKIICEHEYSGWTTETAATCTSGGYSVRTCAKCGETDRRAIPPAGHKASEFAHNQSVHTFTCDTCNKEICEQHKFDEHEVCTVCEYIADYTLGLKYEFDTESRTYTVVKSVSVKKVKNLVIPSTYKNYPVTKIAACAFLWESFKSVTLPEGIISIGQSAFENTGIASVTMPQSLKSIGDRAFAYCDFKNITLPDGLQKIGGASFLDCKYLTEITIPEGITSLGSRTFYACNALKQITLPQTLTKISDYVFAHCKNLQSVIMPASLKSIGDGAFAYCTNLKSITLPEGVTEIPLRAFDGCKNLSELVLPASLTSIKWCGLLNTSALKTITYNGTTEQWKAVKKTFGWKTLTNNVKGLKINCSDGVLEYFD